MKKPYEDLATQEYLNGKQLTLMSLIVILIIQSIPFIVPQSPEMEWILLGFTAAVSACAVIGAILVQFNADKITSLYRQAFNADFYKTIDTINEFRKSFEDDPEMQEGLPALIELLKSYSKAQTHPLKPPTPEELGISKPDPYDSEEELFS